jgi:putative flavoprotein involved in K+ transport
MRMRDVETVVVGGGQAGLIMSALLTAANREHVVLERRPTLGGGWQDRWNAFQLVSPNWTASVPGLDYDGAEPDGFMTRDELIGHFQRYAAAIAAPVELETDVTRLSPLPGGRPGAARFQLETSRGILGTRDVIVAGGPFQTPHVPPIAATLDPSIRQLHSHAYRKPADLPPGRVLLIGTGQSGTQLAEELVEAGREVVLAVGRCGTVPRMYRGRDFFWWLRQLSVQGPAVGLALPLVGDLPSPAARFACNPQLSGHGGGHTVNLREMAQHGYRLAGRFLGVEGTVARFGPDLGANLRFADEFFADRLRWRFDALDERLGLGLPPAELPIHAYEPPDVTELDLRAEGITSILWTSGYRPAFTWIDLPILDDFGLPRQVGGVTEIPGLTFIGLPWMVDMGSANLVGVARDAEQLATRWD